MPDSPKREIPDYIVTAVKDVLEIHGPVAATKLVRSALSSIWIEYKEVEYYYGFKTGRLNTPTLLWCRDYVRKYQVNKV